MNKVKTVVSVNSEQSYRQICVSINSKQSKSLTSVSISSEQSKSLTSVSIIGEQSKSLTSVPINNERPQTAVSMNRDRPPSQQCASQPCHCEQMRRIPHAQPEKTIIRKGAALSVHHMPPLLTDPRKPYKVVVVAVEVVVVSAIGMRGGLQKTTAFIWY